MKFNIHLQCNVDREAVYQKVHSRKDFYNIIKVDNHIHLSTCMNQKHLQKFIKKKLLDESDTIINVVGDQQIRLGEVMQRLGLDPATLTVDVVESYNINRSEKYINKYYPINHLSLKDIFLSSDNYIKGRYFGEIVKEVIKGIDEEKYVLAEYRISIFGRDKNE